MLKNNQKATRFCIDVASAGATISSANAKSHKNIKNWREAVKYLPRVDRAGVLRRMGSVLTLDKVTLRHAMEREYVGQQQRKGAAVECSNSGVAHCSHSSHGGNRLERRDKERRKRESLRDQRTVSQALARSLNPNVDGSDPRTLGTTGKLQILQQIVVSIHGDGKYNTAEGSLVYVESPHIRPIE